MHLFNREAPVQPVLPRSVVVEILFRIADQTGRFAQYYDGDILREVNSKEMKCLVHVVYHQ